MEAHFIVKISFFLKRKRKIAKMGPEQAQDNLRQAPSRPSKNTHHEISHDHGAGGEHGFAIGSFLVHPWNGFGYFGMAPKSPPRDW